MKRSCYFFLLLLMICSGGKLWSQSAAGLRKETAKNELSLNMLNLLAFGALDVSYERMLQENTSLGFHVFSKVIDKNRGEENDLSGWYDKNFALSSQFQVYLNDSRYAEGFYVEVFGMYSKGENEKEIIATDPETGEEKRMEKLLEYNDLALGLGAGMKYVQQNFLIDLSLGIGRNLFAKDSPNFVLLPAVNVGYRF